MDRCASAAPRSTSTSTEQVAELHERAITAGATSIRPPTDPDLPLQSAKFRDPFGHIWLLTRSA